MISDRHRHWAGVEFLCHEGITNLANKPLAEFLMEECKRKGLPLRRLSINAGLSASTAYNSAGIKYQPFLFSLNRLADYLGVKRQYLWQLADLLREMDYAGETTFGDPQLKFYFAQADKLLEAARNLIISVVAAIIVYLEIVE